MQAFIRVFNISKKIIFYSIFGLIYYVEYQWIYKYQNRVKSGLLVHYLLCTILQWLPECNRKKKIMLFFLSCFLAFCLVCMHACFLASVLACIFALPSFPYSFKVFNSSYTKQFPNNYNFEKLMWCHVFICS